MNKDFVQWETFRFPISGGLDTKSASSATAPDKLQVLQNGEFTKRSSVRKRRGYTMVENYTGTALPIGTARGIASRGRELFVVNDRRLYSKTKRNQLQDRGPFCSATRTSRDVAQTITDQTHPAMATVNGYTAYVWQESPNVLKFSVEDDDGTVYTHDQSLASGTCARPSAVAIGSTLLLTYIDTSTNEFMVKAVQTTDLTGSLGDAPVARLGDFVGMYALHADGYIAWQTNGTGALAAGIGLARLGASGAVTAPVLVSSDTPDSLAIAVNEDICVAWCVAPDRKYRIYDTDMAPTAAAVSLTTDADVVRCAVAPSDDSFAFAFEGEGATEDLNYVDLITDAGTSTVQRAYLGSAGFALDDRGMFVLGYQSRTGLQNSYLLYDDQANCLGSLANGIASDRPAVFNPSPLSETAIVLSTHRSLDVDQFEAQFAHNNLRRYDFNVAAPVSAAEHGESTYLSGSQLWLYDGVSAVEAGFHLFPDVKEGTTTATAVPFNDFTPDDTGTGLVTEVQYNYRFYYEWYTVAGERIRSFALQRSITPEFASGTGAMIIEIPCLTHTLKHADAEMPRSDVSIVVYRSFGNLKDVFCRVTNPNPDVDTGANCYLRNTGESVTFVDNYTDEEIRAFEQDLESYLELKHLSPPAPTRVTATGTRIFIAGGEVAEGTVIASKQRNPGDTCQFAGELAVLVAPTEITELGPIDDSVVCFTRDRMYLVSGEINNVGEGEFDSQLLTSDVGCTDPGSVAVFPKGLMFKSAKGIYGVGRGGDVGYIGEFVESHNSQTVRDARMIPDTNQVVFLCEDGTTLMYDYHYEQWGTFTNHLGVSGCVTEDGQYAYLRNDGTVFIRSEDPEYCSDAGSPYTMKLRTGNYTFEAGQLYWRLRRAGVLGEYKTEHQLRMSTYYNRDPFPSESAVWNPLIVIDTALWGSEALWGTSLARWGGSIGGTDYQFFRRVRRQKAQQVRFEFEDVISGQAGASYELTEILLEVGVMPGPARVSPGRKV